LCPAPVKLITSSESLIKTKLDPWDALYILEERLNEPGFRERWRRFVRSVVPLLPGLPPEADRWWSAADAFESGRLDRDGLGITQSEAFRHLSDLSHEMPVAKYCSVRAAMQPLWDHNTGGGWFDGAWCFLQDCCAAGVDEAAWWPLFWAAYPEFGGGSRAEPKAAPDPDQAL
jgi:hypothetical protein